MKEAPAGKGEGFGSHRADDPRIPTPELREQARLALPSPADVREHFLAVAAKAEDCAFRAHWQARPFFRLVATFARQSSESADLLTAADDMAVYRRLWMVGLGANRRARDNRQRPSLTTIMGGRDPDGGFAA